MADDRPEAAPPHGPVDETLPQWKPPASATRPGISGTREAAAQTNPGPALVDAGAISAPPADVSGFERTLSATPSLAPPGVLRVGDTIGDRYVIEQHISSGGFGAVYRASDRQIRNHQVALKLLHNPAADEQARQGALRELTLIASVSHPSVVQFKDYGWHEGRLWFAMPWYRGQTLAQRFASSDGLAPISRAEARPIFTQLAQGLAAMHKVGVHHHDIKPDNIFLAEIAGFENGLPVLLDLGIASERGENPKGLTLEYASPETAAVMLGNPEKHVGPAADVFSLALVLRNLLDPESIALMTGELVPLLHRRATERIAPPRKREFKYLVPAFERWLDLEPDRRPSAAEFAAELAVLTQPEEEREARARLLRRIVPVVLAAGAIVAILLLQVRKQKTELIVERERLTQQVSENEVLKKRTSEQLQQLESESHRAAGSQTQLLARATQNAHQFKQLFEKADDRADALGKKLKKASDERDAVEKERENVQRDRDGLITTRDALTRERDALVSARDGLQRERDSLAHARSQLEEERNTVVGQRNDAIRERDRSETERRRAQAELDSASSEQTALKNEIKDLRSQLNSLQAERERLAAAKAAAETSPQKAPNDIAPQESNTTPTSVRPSVQRRRPGQGRFLP